MNTLLFDLDGTIADSADGILASVRAALAELDVEVAAGDDLRWLIGPPIGQAFARLLGGMDRVEHAVGVYRRHYSERGLLACKPYPGIAAELHRLHAAGHTLFVCTSKLTVFARRLIDQFELGAVFTGIYGVEAGRDGEDKIALLARILEQHDIDKGHCHMIGDRREDIRAGVENGIATVGVLWGYGDLDEIMGAGATAVCDLPENLGAVLQPMNARR